MSKKNWRTSIIAAIVIALISVLSYTTGTGGSFHYVENPLRDALSGVMQQHEPDTQIKIIKIDSKSLEAIGQYPWDRTVYANLIEKLQSGKVAAVGVDVLFPEPSKEAKNDQALADIMKKYKNVVLPVNVLFPPQQKSADQLEYERIEYPTAAINAPKSQIAHINVFPDTDDKVRRLIVGIPEKEGGMIEAFSVKLANLALPAEEQVRWDEADKQWKRGSTVIPTNSRNQVLTQFYTKPRQDADLKTGYSNYSFSDVLSGKVPALEFENDIVLIGPFSTGLQDEYMTPMSKVIKMFGVEVHANMLQSILDGQFWVELHEGYGIALLLALVLLTFYLFNRFKGRSAIFVYVGALILYMAAFELFNEAFHIFLPIFYPLMAITLMYVWSIIHHYLAERQERNRVTGIFGRFVPKTVVDKMLTSGDEVKLGGERMDITLIFVDIRGFTTLSEKLEPEQVIAFLNEYLDVCTKAVFKFNGTLDKFIGDGVMAIFGAPIRYDNHTELAVRSALEMKKQSAILEQKLMEKLGFTVRFGIGINCGPAVVGNIGSEDLRLDYTAIGDTVNLSARLESNAKPGQILISENVYNRVGHLFEIESMGEIKVKGKELPVPIYQVHAEKGLSEAAASAEK
ncbi:CHASE2 domain-containing protein [Paenibacillus koleovorans]|uniref:CHASE2 domain-containing protein n=1 Tax=Paenibacillus koleovorans TaxID=121608 RepID=UPI000FD7E256|nr:adenylate/guanylate cyclase domain-containing protein [Paenibacillus koleovorans]